MKASAAVRALAAHAGLPALLIAGRALGALAGMLFLMLLTAHAGAGTAGIVATHIALAMLLGLAATLNIEAGGVRILVPAIAEGRTAQALGFVRFSERFVILFSLALTGLACALIAGLAELHLPIALALASVPLLALARLGSGWAMGFSRVALGTLPRSCLRQCLFLAGLAALLAAGEIPGPAALLGLFLGVNAAVLVVQRLALAGPRRRLARAAPPDEADAPAWLRLGLTLAPNVLYLEFALHLTIFTSAFVLAPADVARLDVALKIAALLKFGSIAVNQAFLPRLSGAIAAGEAATLARWLAISALVRLIAIGAGAAILLAALPWLLSLFGPEFAGLAPVVLIVAAEPLLAVLFGPGHSLVMLSRQPARLLPVLGAALSILILGTLGAGHAFGPAGAAASVLAAAGFWAIALARTARRHLGTDPTLAAALRWWLARNEGEAKPA